MLYILFGIISIALWIYSYGFLDFNLTLSSNQLFLNFVAPLQHLVYFERTQSARVYVAILVIMFLLYAGILVYGKTGKIHSFPWKPVLIIIAILTFSYPMLSYDVYNYMFHGKILWFYHMSPHAHAPLEFGGDLWLRFMRWVHTPSAYGPVFTAIESPAYLLGFGKFVPVLILMKLSMSAFFVWCIYLVGRIATLLGFSKARTVQAQLLLALNPFLLLDSVINGHNDSVMMALFLLGLYFSIKSQLVPSLVSLAASIGTKFVTAFTLPIYFIKSPKLKVLFSFLAMLLPVLVSPGRFQPWYLVWSIIPAVLVDSALVRTWVVLASVAGAAYYIPYIATGFWVNSLPFVSLILYTPILLSIVITRLSKLRL